MRDVRQPFVLPGDPAGTATGSTLPETVAHIQALAVQIAGTFTATIKIKGRLHSSLPMVEIASVSAPGITAISAPVSDIELEVSAYTNGTISAWFAGFNAQL